MIDIFDEIDGLLSEENDETTKATLQRIADHMRVTDSANVQAVGIAAELQGRLEELETENDRRKQMLREAYAFIGKSAEKTTCRSAVGEIVTIDRDDLMRRIDNILNHAAALEQMEKSGDEK